MTDSPGYAHFEFQSAAPTCTTEYVLPPLVELAGDLAKNARVLDAGCGNGHMAPVFLSRGCSYTGVDLSPSGIETARATNPEARFVLAPVDDRLREHVGSGYDLVISVEVVEHLYDPASFARGCFDVLRPGGRLVVSTPFHGWLKNVAIALAGKHDRHYDPKDLGGHIRFWSRSTLSSLLEDAGFLVRDFRGAGRYPLLWKSMVLAADRPQR